MSYKAVVGFTSLRSSLANLPQSAASALQNGNIPPQRAIVQISASLPSKEKKPIYLGWTGLVSKGGRKTKSGASVDSLELDPAFALSLGLREGQAITITLHADAEYAHKVFLEPLEPSDWDVIETNARFVESWMINQVRAIAVGQIITVYPSSSMISRLRVTAVDPQPRNGVSLLSPDSEVAVAPKIARPSKPGLSNGPKNGSSVTGSRTNSAKKTKRSSGVLLRHFVEPDSDDGAKAQQIWISDRFLHTFKASNYAYISPIPFPKNTDENPTASKEPSENMHEPTKRIIVFVNYIPDAVFGHVRLSQTVSIALGLENESFGHMIRLELPTKSISKSSERVILHPLKNPENKNLQLGGKLVNLSKAECQLIVQELEKLGPITANQLLPIPLPIEMLEYGCIIEMKSTEWMPRGSKISVLVGEEWPGKNSDGSLLSQGKEKDGDKDKDKDKEKGKTLKLAGVEQTLQMYVDSVLSSEGGTLIYGSRGCGKSSVLKELSKSLNKDLVTTIWFSCSVNSEKSLQFLKDSIKKLFLEAAWYSPSVIIFDDLDKIIRAESESGAGAGAGGEKSRQLAEFFKTIYDQTVSSRNVTILATSASKQSIHGSLLTRHVFEDVFHHKAPDKEVREKILQDSIKEQGVEYQGQLVDVVGETEGYQPGDLWTLVEGAVYQSMISDDYDPTSCKLLPKHFTQALEAFSPASLRGVKLQKSGTSWSDIGGLRETKSVILETLEWPTKYAPIFSNCPLRLRSGLLLYGYPGCGKTLLASAVASQCGLNFISVKGPEILNKYIGASEQSVRDLFERAQTAKPCVLFFDEFDSLAPKRGHDSTGVTDRVVNQMLTQMDGAEGLDGVYILAATSRPDLIDSALLRPGRLDKSLICDMPDESDRLDILKTAAKTMKLSEAVDLTEYARRTEGFSGADLHALMYNANLASIQDILRISEQQREETKSQQPSSEGLEITALQGEVSFTEEEQMRKSVQARNGRQSQRQSQKVESESENEHDDRKDGDNGTPQIEASHMELAMNQTKPSISSKERQRLGRIYQQFISGRDGSMPSGTASNEIGGRVTLM